MVKKIRPIIKWTGGKFKEFALFESFIPKFDRYIEPFFGGGGVFFALQPTGIKLLNDKSKDLISFYKELREPEFKQALGKFVTLLKTLDGVIVELWQELRDPYVTFYHNKISLDKFVELVSVGVMYKLENNTILNSTEITIDPAAFKHKLIQSTVDKAKRIKRITDKEARIFNEDELFAHFETGIKSGNYLFFREILNSSNHSKQVKSSAQLAAIWYFIREFCYGSMFRFNSSGEFNIPYGGISYNKKNFKDKVDQIFSPQVSNLFTGAEIFNLDFEEFLNFVAPKANDFIFLDPPYDSEFSEYDQNAFNQSDQIRLAKLLLQIPAKWMVVIKETEFIRRIYTHPDVKINVFDKNYSYNVRGRNNRNVQHLIITNY